MNKLIKTFLIKMCQSLFEYVGNPLYKSDNVLEDSVSRIYWHSLPARDEIGFSGIIT
jgi:hypothetical protein